MARTCPTAIEPMNESIRMSKAALTGVVALCAGLAGCNDAACAAIAPDADAALERGRTSGHVGVPSSPAFGGNLAMELSVTRISVRW